MVSRIARNSKLPGNKFNKRPVTRVDKEITRAYGPGLDVLNRVQHHRLTYVLTCAKLSRHERGTVIATYRIEGSGNAKSK